MTTDQDRVLYDLEPIALEEADSGKLNASLSSASGYWYALRRLAAFKVAGLTAAGKWNSLLHPRGPDGRFITKFGFVRWLDGGIWHRGQVSSIDEDGGVHVTPGGTGWTANKSIRFKNPSKRLYSLPTPKASLDLPNPHIPDGKPGWKKTGGQGGSNPGGFFELDTPKVLDIVLGIDETRDLLDGIDGLERAEFIFEDDIDLEGQLPAKGALSIADVSGKRHLLTSFDNDWHMSADMEAASDLVDGGQHEPNWWETALFGNLGSDERQAALASIELWEPKSGIGQDEWFEPIASKTQEVEFLSGDSFYVKTTKSTTHARNEVLANSLYEMAGVAVPDMVFGSDSNEVGSKIVEGEVTISLSEGLKDPQIAQKIREDMVVDAWLANWDVAGLGLDNIIVVDGTPFRIDTGGALEKRAQGGAKGHLFGNSVGELDTFTNGMNSSSKATFHGISINEKKAGATRVAAISPQQVKDVVAEHGLSEALADKLISRRKYILDKYEITDPFTVVGNPIKAPTGTPVVAKLDFVNAAWNPIDKQWQHGSLDHPANVYRGQYFDYIDSISSKVAPVGTVKPGTLFYDMEGELWQSHIGGIDYEMVFINQFDGKKLAHNDYIDQVKIDFSVRILSEDPALIDGIVEQIKERRATYMAAQIAEDAKSIDTFVALTTGESTGADGTFVPRTRTITYADWMSITEYDMSREQGKPFDEVGGTYFIAPDGSTFEVVDFTKVPNTVTFKNVTTGEAETFSAGKLPMTTLTRPTDEFTTQLIEAKIARDKALLSTEEPPVIEVPKKKSVSVWGAKAKVAGTPPTEVAVEAAKTDPPPVKDVVPGSFKVADGYTNVKIPVSGEVFSLYDLEKRVGKAKTAEERDAILSPLIGQSIVVSKPNGTKGNVPQWGGDSAVGSWKITNATSVENYGGRIDLALKSPNGTTDRIVGSYSKNESHVPFSDSDIVITPIALDASIPQQAPSFKKNGDIVVNGIVVGTHVTDESYGYGGWGSANKDYEVFISAEFSATGEKLSYKRNRQKDAKKDLAQFVVPLNALEIHEKIHGGSADKLEKAAKASAVEGPSVGALIDGTEARKGQWVESAKDGFVGQITNWPNQEKYPGMVYVKPPEGGEGLKKKLRKITTLKSVSDPSKPVPTATPYDHLSTSDGKIPAIGQKVTAGKKNNPVTGTIVKINPTKGWVTIQPDDGGKKIIKTLGTTTVLEDAPDLPASAIAAKAAGFDPPSVSIPSAKFATEEGEVLEQSAKVKAAWTAVPKRKLTRDGYAPQLGMRVRDSKSNALVIIEINSPYTSQPNRVKTMDIKTGEMMYRTVSALNVDHAAELGSQVGKDFHKIRNLVVLKSNDHYKNGPSDFFVKMPEGSILYKTTGSIYVKGSGYRTVDSYLVVDPAETGYITQINDYGASRRLSKNQLPAMVTSGVFEKVGVFSNDDDGNSVALKRAFSEDMSQVLVPFDPTIQTPEEAVGIVAAKQKSSAVPGTKDPDSMPGVQILDSTKLSKPASAAVHTSGADPDLPIVTAEGSDFDKLPEQLRASSANTLAEAVDKIIDAKDSTDVNSGSLYSVGDSEYVEDMLFQTQIVKEGDSEFAEIRFRMMEEKAEKTAKKILGAKAEKYGGWSAIGDEAYPTDLVEGDVISIRRSASTGMLKPNIGTNSSPNAQLLEPPVLLGKNENDIEVYRVMVVGPAGDIGEIDIELRSAPSIQRFEWDSDLVVDLGKAKLTVTDTAVQDGWIDAGNIGIEAGVMNGSTPAYNKIFTDKTGAKTQTGALIESPHSGKRILKKFDDGSSVRMNVSHSAMGGTSHGAIRRSNYTGDVFIRVPVDATPEDRRAAVSKAMESVGIPIEAQGAPTNEHLTKFALNKVSKTFSPSYSHRESLNFTSLDENDPEVQKIFGYFKTVEPKLGRKVTLADFQIHTYEDGRMQVTTSPELAGAIASRQGNKYYTHNTGASVEIMADVLGGASPGLMSTHERWNMGIITHGQSSGTDMKNGAGNRVYLTGKKAGSVSGGKKGFIFSATSVNMSTEIYVNTHDGFGKRKTQNTFISQGGAYEYMYKRKLLPEQMARAKVGNTADKKKLIKLLNDRGITEINGIPLDTFIMVGGDSISTTTDEFQALGTQAAEDVLTVADLAVGFV